MAVCASSQYDSRADKLQARRLLMTGDIQPLKKRAISGRSAFLGVESRDGEVLASAAAVEMLGEELEVLLDTHARDLMGPCPFVLGSCGGVSTQVDVEGGRGAEAGCTACAALTGTLGRPGQHSVQERKAGETMEQTEDCWDPGFDSLWGGWPGQLSRHNGTHLRGSLEGARVQDLGCGRLAPVVRAPRPRVHLHSQPRLRHVHHHLRDLVLQNMELSPQAPLATVLTV